MAAVAIAGIGTALNVGTSLAGMSASKSAANKQKRALRIMGREEIKKMGRENERVLGSAKAQIAASGFTGYGASTMEYMDELRREQGRSIHFAEQSRRSGMQVVTDQAGAQQFGYGMDALSGLVSGIGQIGNTMNWGLDSNTATANVGGSQGGGSQRYSRGG